MAEGNTEAAANAFLAALVQGVPFALAEAWLAPCLGPPGADGTDNPAAETRRFDLTAMFGTSPSGGVVTNDAVSDTMTSVAATEDWTHWAIFDDEFAGTCYRTGQMTGGSVTAGQDVQIGAAQLSLTQPVAS